MLTLLAAHMALHNGGNPYLSFAERLRAAKSLSGRVSLTTVTPDRTSNVSWTFAFQRPNLWRFEFWTDKRYDFLSVSDGKDMWTLDAIQMRLNKQTSPDQGTGISFAELEPYLSPQPATGPQWRLDSPQGRTSRFHGRKAIEYLLRFVEPGAQSPAPDAATMRLFLDPKTHLPLGSMRTQKATKLEFVFSDLRVDPKIEPAIFTYRSRIAVTNPVLEDYLLPLGSVAPRFRGRVLSGGNFDLKESLARSKAVVLNFWAPGCPPCIQEMPVFEELNRQYTAKGLEVITIFMEDRPRASIEDLVRKVNLSLPVVLGATCQPDIVLGYKATIFPITYLLDSKGAVIGTYDSTRISKLKEDVAALGLR